MKDMLKYTLKCNRLQFRGQANIKNMQNTIYVCAE